MIKSMTGYGRGEITLHNRKFIVEIKSVNHRYTDISVKLPKLLNQFEDMVKKTVSEFVFRGKTDIFISYQSFSKNDVKVIFNESLADAYINEIKKIDEGYGFNQKNYLEMLLRFPDILVADSSSLGDNSLNEMKEALLLALDNALGEFVKMREKEGLALKNDLYEKSFIIEEIVNNIESRASLIADELRTKLHTRIKEILADVTLDEGRLLTEVAIQAERISVDEELIRLKSHITQLRDILTEGGTVGRKLDFLIQEMNREANTIGSKSNDLSVTNWVVDLKSQIEKVREQIQNIE